MSEVKDFDALFSADIEPVRRHFSIQGHECWVDLRPMSAGDVGRYRTLAIRLAQGAADTDLHTVIMYLVEKTLVDWCLWRTSKRLDNGELVWEQDLSSAVLVRDRRKWIENWKPTAEFWDWIARECLLVNNLLDEEEVSLPIAAAIGAQAVEA